ncbi:MAG: hypothetical protein KBC84_02855 [Proteobacteria bacterium]|nr:hypothetical protein [Pseudomonadota bacterium]
MSRAYTPGLTIEENIKIVKRRELPLPGEVLFKVGDRVKAEQEVLKAELAGELEIIRISERLGLEPEKITEGLKVKKGDRVQVKDLLCEVKGFLGLFNSEYHSPTEGEVEFYLASNGHLGIRKPPQELTIKAFINGKVVEVEEKKSLVIETQGDIIQGIFGVGGERLGEVFYLDIPNHVNVTAELIENLTTSLENKILIGGANFDYSALKACAARKIRGVVTASIDAQTLRDFVGFEIGVSITGDEDVPFSLIITEGFGNLSLSERVCNLAKKINGKQASISGATQVRAGAIRPELIVSEDRSLLAEKEIKEKSLDIGSRVRMIRVPFFGQFGSIVDLPQQPHLIPSGAEVRVAKVRLEGSVEEVLIPRANLELM